MNFYVLLIINQFIIFHRYFHKSPILIIIVIDNNKFIVTLTRFSHGTKFFIFLKEKKFTLD